MGMGRSAFGVMLSSEGRSPFAHYLYLCYTGLTSNGENLLMLLYGLPYIRYVYPGGL